MSDERAGGCVADELCGAELNDRRLNRRLERIVEAISSEPDKPFPSLLSTDAELEGFYRFLSNDNVSFEALVEPHIDATADRAMQLTTALAVHDTTEFRFAGEGREGLGCLNKGGRGFLGHFCVGVSADGRRDPLGLLGRRPGRGPSRRQRSAATAKRSALVYDERRFVIRLCSDRRLAVHSRMTKRRSSYTSFDSKA